MEQQAKELMEKYIYEVIRRVPEGQKKEIRMELEELIGDMYEAESGDMERVLQKLGDPKVFARKYRGDLNYIIGPEYYDNYVWIIKIVLICSIAANLFSAVLSLFMPGQEWKHLSEAWGMDMISSGVWGVGLVTLIFAFLERAQVKVDLDRDRSWKPGDLKAIPHRKALISRWESAISIIFLVILNGLLFFAPHLLGAYVFEEGEFIKVIPVFNLEQWATFLPVLLTSFLFALIDTIIRLVTGRYTKIVLLSGIITGVAEIILGYIICRVLPLWNPDFAVQLGEEYQREFTAAGDLLNYWNTATFGNIMFGLICLAAILEMATTIYKTIRYGELGN